MVMNAFRPTTSMFKFSLQGKLVGFQKSDFHPGIGIWTQNILVWNTAHGKKFGWKAAIVAHVALTTSLLLIIAH